MSEHKITVEWKRTSPDFSYEAYSRDHAVTYGDGSRICVSAAPEYFGNPSCFNPEQAFAASLASCHMLTFLAYCSKKRYVVDSYNDDAMCVLGTNDKRQIAVTKVELRPVVTFGGTKIPTEEEYQALHVRAHGACFIANSIASCVEVVVAGKMVVAEVGV